MTFIGIMLVLIWLTLIMIAEAICEFYNRLVLFLREENNNENN